MVKFRSLFAATLLAAPLPAAAESLFDPYVDARWRLELVEQDRLPRDAAASTLRVLAGVKAGPWHGFSAQVEGEAITRIGAENFNDTINGRTQFPVVADPSDHQLNQALIGWRDKALGSASVGRQAVNLDNQRWVGSVAWRQNDQTIDIARAELTALKGVTLGYGYGWRVNRIFGPRSPQGVWRDSDIHLLRATADLKPIGNLVAYAYLLDLRDAPTMSSNSFGARLVGSQKLGSTALLYTLEYARQTGAGTNPRHFTVDYLLVEPGLKIGAVTGKVGYERLSGNGQAALQTPLATLHAFNGWADKFLVTPTDGLRDLYVDVAVAPMAKGLPEGLVLRAILHDFRSTIGNRAYGREFDAQIAVPVSKRVSLLAKAALYEARGFGVDTMRLWLQAEARF
jgi:hypothetical protein